MSVFEKIEAQQKGKEDTTVWMVGEQLKDICREDLSFAEIVLADLENESMSIDKCEKQIKAYADKHRKGSCACVPPNVADRIIRKFYGLPGQAEKKPETAPQTSTEAPTSMGLDLSSYF